MRIKYIKNIVAAVSIIAIFSACGESDQGTDKVEQLLQEEAYISAQEKEAGTSEAVTEESITEAESSSQTVMTTDTEAVTEVSDEEMTTEESTSETTEEALSEVTEAVSAEEETDNSVAAPSIVSSELSESKMKEMINDNIDFLYYLVLTYPEDYDISNYWKHIFCTANRFCEPRVWPVYISEEDLIKWSNVMFAEFEEIPDIPEEYSEHDAITRTESGYQFSIGDPAQRMVGYDGITCENGRYMVSINVYGADLYEPFCKYVFTLIPNDNYDSSVSWDLPFSICDISVIPDEYTESYYYNGIWSEDGILEITEESANIRSTPDKTASDNITGTAYKGERFISLGYDGYWYKIDYNGNKAYISHKMVKEIAEYLP